jgi:D-alanine-D-alanine ligase
MSARKVLLMCGGQSEEHNVSLASARSILKVSGRGTEITPMVIDQAGTWLSPEESVRLLDDPNYSSANFTSHADSGIASLLTQTYDVIFPLFHGPFGEDGSIQGLLKILGLPHVGSGTLGSSVGMDKIMMKQVFAACGLPQVDFKPILHFDWLANPEAVLADLAPLNMPVYVKPANLGSSVGISQVNTPRTLPSAIKLAFEHDRRVIVEQGLTIMRELEVGVLGNDNPNASAVGEIGYASDFYNYATKYTEGLADLIIPAPIPHKIATTCRQLALEAFRAIDCAGLARVDFFYLPENSQIYLNEINTMPGFTETSMYPKLWEASGLTYQMLVGRLIDLAMEPR